MKNPIVLISELLTGFSPKTLKIVKNKSTYLLGYLISFLKSKKYPISRIIVLHDNVKIKVSSLSDYLLIGEIWADKAYNPPGFEIKSSDTVIDVGAHKGYFSIFAAQKAKKVYGYEPVHENFGWLKENIQINNLKNVVAYQLAICGKKGKRNISIDRSALGHSFYIKGKKETIKCITLNDVFIENKIRKCDLLKLDCEGAEYEILFNTKKCV